MNPNKTGDLDSQGIGKLLLRLALPTITAQLVNALYNMVDRIYIGHIPVVGKTALTGVGVCLSLIMIISAFAALTAMGGATRASILLGKGQRDTAERILGNCVTGSVVVGLVLTAVFLSFSRPLLLAFGASEETIVYAVQYMKIYALGTVFVELALGLNAFITAQGFASVAMISVLIGAVANMILDAESPAPLWPRSFPRAFRLSGSSGSFWAGKPAYASKKRTCDWIGSSMRPAWLWACRRL